MKHLVLVGLPIAIGILLTYGISRSEDQSPEAWLRRALAYTLLGVTIASGLNLSRED